MGSCSVLLRSGQIVCVLWQLASPKLNRLVYSHLKCSPGFLLVCKFFGCLCLTAPDCDSPVRVAGSVTAAVCAKHSEIPGLRRYGHYSALIKPNVILTTGGFGEEEGQHRRMRSFHVLIKHAGCWRAGSLKRRNPGERWGEFPR